MPFCPNPECPHIKKSGKPAEYVAGVSNRSDCDCQLAAQLARESAARELSKCVLALMVSSDGPIRVYQNDKEVAG